jgi:lectin, mannose-binding 1
LTAVTTDTPDSFEIYKFVTSLPSRGGGQARQGISQPKRSPPRDTPQYGWSTPEDEIRDALASSIETQEAQFADLHDRMQSMGHGVSELLREVKRGNALIQGKMDYFDSRLSQLERAIQDLGREIGSRDYEGHLEDIRSSLKDRHESLLQTLPDTLRGGGSQLAIKDFSSSDLHTAISSGAPNMGYYITILIAFQLALVGLYIAYKRRRSSSKKYL